MRYVKKNDIFITKIAASYNKEGPDNSATLPILYHLNLSNDYKRVKVTLYMGLKKCKNGKMIKYCKKVPLKLQSTGRKPAI